MSEIVLVTGAAGFIGSRLALALIARGDRVVGLDNLNDYYPVVHKRRRLAELAAHKNFTFIEADLRDADVMRDIIGMHNPAAIAHVAAMAAVRYSVEHPLLYGAVNVQGSMNLMDAARQGNGRRLVMASTGSVYGSNTPIPFAETAAADRPLAPYPASKRAMELMAHSFHHLWKLPITVLRFFNVYGPEGRPDMMPWQWSRMILRGQTLTLYNAGHLQRDWTYVDDIVAGFLAALDKPMGFELINLGCSRPVENIDFVKTLEKLLGRDAKIQSAPTPSSEPMITHADISKARQLLGYDPKTDVETGLARFIDWAKAQRVFDT